ncbi:hypothetical protein CUMW_179100 [Citrus unshiu]|uniref:Protein kinase domain-containing protein n=2 Tax=Citrus TaxID=2706 RepID=A0A2H5PYE6_CITUN|nr:hypothetical protein CUMW_179100 [Citrus unshiu]
MGLCLGKSKSSGKADKSTVKLMNNKVLLEKLIAFSNDNYNPIRDFSFQELTTTTNNYNKERIIIQESGYILYKGVLNARAVSIVKFGENYNSDNQYKFCFNNILGQGDISYITPKVLLEAKCNEKYDVHSFGMLLLDLLTGQKITSFCRDKRLGIENYLWDLLKKYVEEDGLNEMVDPMIIEEGLCPIKEQLL